MSRCVSHVNTSQLYISPNSSEIVFFSEFKIPFHTFVIRQTQLVPIEVKSGPIFVKQVQGFFP